MRVGPGPRWGRRREWAAAAACEASSSWWAGEPVAGGSSARRPRPYPRHLTRLRAPKHVQNLGAPTSSLHRSPASRSSYGHWQPSSNRLIAELSSWRRPSASSGGGKDHLLDELSDIRRTIHFTQVTQRSNDMTVHGVPESAGVSAAAAMARAYEQVQIPAGLRPPGQLRDGLGDNATIPMLSPGLCCFAWAQRLPSMPCSAGLACSASKGCS